jgi:hypothetical protein
MRFKCDCGSVYYTLSINQTVYYMNGGPMTSMPKFAPKYYEAICDKCNKTWGNHVTALTLEATMVAGGVLK